MALNRSEQEIVAVFQQADFSGRIFRIMESCVKHIERTWRPGISCPGYGREIGGEVCGWHSGAVDPVCVDCGRRRAQ